MREGARRRCLSDGGQNKRRIKLGWEAVSNYMTRFDCVNCFVYQSHTTKSVAQSVHKNLFQLYLLTEELVLQSQRTLGTCRLHSFSRGDSKENWDHELKIMRDVYTYAICNLTASNSRSRFLRDSRSRNLVSPVMHVHCLASESVMEF